MTGIKHHWSRFCLFVFFVLLSHSAYCGNDLSWIRGEGESLEIRIWGEVMAPEGTNLSGLELNVRYRGPQFDHAVKAELEGNRFHAWVPIGRSEHFSLVVTAKLPELNLLAQEKIYKGNVRKASLEGLVLELKTAKRQVRFAIAHDGVPIKRAHLQLSTSMGTLHSESDDQGTATVLLQDADELYQVVAWTGDHKIGGYTWDRKPIKDPNKSEYRIEMSRCRNQVLRFLDASGKPIVGLNFQLSVATPPPDYNLMGCPPMADLTTDDRGEAVYEWFPDWDEFQIEIFSSDRQWVVPTSQWRMNQKVIEVTCTPSKWSERMTLEGTVYEAGKPAPGILVVASSFQGEQEHHCDRLWTFTDLSGSFRFKLLPGSTYCAHIDDQASIGEFVEVPPVAKGEAHKPIELIADKGIPVEIRLTSGQDRKPIPYQTVSIRRSHTYSWKEDGETRYGNASHDWWIKTDENGIAHTQTLRGEFQASVYTPTWRDEKNLKVVDQNKIEITLHRNVEIARKIMVRLRKPDDATSSLANATIQAQPLDRQQFHQDTVLRTAQDGTVTFEGFVDAFVFDAHSADGKLARVISSKEIQDAVDIELLPATTIEGTLTDEEGNALADRSVQCSVTWFAKEDGAKIRIFRRSKTDAAGKFTMPGLPQGTRVELYTDHLTKRDFVETFLRTSIEPGKVFEHKTYVIGSQPKPVAKTLEVLVASAIRDSQQNNYRTLLILSGDEKTQTFINEHLLDYDSNPNVARFMQVVVQPTNGQLPEADSLFLKEKNWTIPGESMVSILLLGENGEKQSQLDVNIESSASKESVAQFLQSNLPPKYDFKEKWQQALASAKREDKAIWLRLGGRYCGPCFMLTRWIHEHKSTIEKDFILVKVDDSDENWREAESILERQGGDGIPFHGIFNSAGELLLNSRDQNENIGFPSDTFAKAHMKAMLLHGRKTISDGEIQKLMDTLPEK